MRPEDYTIIDIETYPNKEMIDRLPEPKVDARVKDPAKIEAKRAEGRLKQIADMAINPLYGKVACVGYKKENSKGLAIDENEDAVIKRFFEHIISFEGSNSPKIVTWNGMGFDIPFLYKRAMILGIKPPVCMSYFMKRYQTSPHCDLMHVWMNWYGYEKLENVAQALLNEGKQDFDFRTISDLIKTEDGRHEIGKYCMQDVEITSKLFYKMANVLF